MTQKRLDNFTTAELKYIFFNHCVRVEFAYKVNNNYSVVTVLTAKKNQNKELFRVQRTYTRNCFFPKPNEYGYSVGYSVIKGDKVIADVTLKDTNAEYLTDFNERDLYMLLYHRYKHQYEAAKCLGDAFLKALRDKKQIQTR